jgi:hypothetical protein
MLFAGYLLNELIRNDVCIFSMQRLRTNLPFSKKNSPYFKMTISNLDVFKCVKNENR